MDGSTTAEGEDGGQAQTNGGGGEGENERRSRGIEWILSPLDRLAMAKLDYREKSSCNSMGPADLGFLINQD